jgi:hypothetical protein
MDFPNFQIENHKDKGWPFNFQIKNEISLLSFRITYYKNHFSGVQTLKWVGGEPIPIVICNSVPLMIWKTKS